jgi:fimbrial chaperone protein
MNFSNKNLYKTPYRPLPLFGLIILAVCSFSTQAINLTSYRLYLDDNNRTESFIMFTRGNTSEECSIDLKHFNFDESGTMTVYKEKDIPANSANPWIRYSPRNFTVQPGYPQTVRFTMRRKANTTAQEYRSYMAISCDAVVAKEDNKSDTNTNSGIVAMSVKPVIVQNVPIIVRTGPLQASASFNNVNISDNKVMAKLTRSGDRSIYGRLSLIDKNTNEELNFMSGVSLYTETSSYAFNFGIGGKNMPPPEQLLLRFTEDENYGGSIVIEHSLK